MQATSWAPALSQPAAAWFPPGEDNVSYIYVGPEEKSDYINCVAHFDSIGYLTTAYSNSEVKIYLVNQTEMGT